MKEVIQRPESPDWYDLLEQAVGNPQDLADAHRFFKKRSLGNKWLASVQLRAMGLPLQPVHSFKDWLAAKRPVQKGQKATIAQVCPVPLKRKKKDEVSGEEVQEVVGMRFTLRKAWFHLGQTDGEEYVCEDIAQDWDIRYALEEFQVVERPFAFSAVDDFRCGEVGADFISVSELEKYPTLARVRLLSRVVLHHFAEKPSRSVPTDSAMQALEADTTAYLVGATLGLSGMDQTRAVLQQELAGARRIPDLVAQRAFAAADKILNAGVC